VDFKVTGDSLVPDSTTGKAVLTLAVEEGQQYRIGKVEVVGNSRYSTEELGESFRFLLPGQLNNGQDLGLVYDRSQWQAAQERVQTLYSNSGYIRSQVIAEEARR